MHLVICILLPRIVPGKGGRSVIQSCPSEGGYVRSCGGGSMVAIRRVVVWMRIEGENAGIVYESGGGGRYGAMIV